MAKLTLTQEQMKELRAAVAAACLEQSLGGIQAALDRAFQFGCQARAKRDAEICRTPEILDDDGTGYKQYLIRSAETCANEIEKDIADG